MFRPRFRRSTPPVRDAEGEASPGLDPEAAHDERLIRSAQAGDLAAFNLLVARHERAVYAVCLRMLGDAASAEDAAQDAFIRAWTAIQTFQGGLARAWLLRIASNRCYDILRARGRRPADSLDAELFEIEPAWTSQTTREDPEGFAARAELGDTLERALAALPDDQRLVVILSDIEGHDYETIAGIAGIAVGTVKSRLSRARARLRDTLRADPVGRELLAQHLRSFDE